MVDLEQVFDPEDQHLLKDRILKHFEATGSPRARRILEHWSETLPKFVKVYPHEFKRVMKKRQEAAQAAAQAAGQAALLAQVAVVPERQATHG